MVRVEVHLEAEEAEEEGKDAGVTETFNLFFGFVFSHALFR